MTVFGQSGRGPEVLACDAAAAALADVAVMPSDVGQVFLANAAAGLLSGQEMIRGQVFLADSGPAGVPMVNVENACASSLSACSLAVCAVRAGAVELHQRRASRSWRSRTRPACSARWRPRPTPSAGPR